MKTISSTLLLSMVVGAAYAQAPAGGVTMSTDPAKAAEVERHAQELKARQSESSAAKPAATYKSTAKPKAKTPATHKSSTAKPAKAPKS